MQLGPRQTLVLLFGSLTAVSALFLGLALLLARVLVLSPTGAILLTVSIALAAAVVLTLGLLWAAPFLAELSRTPRSLAAYATLHHPLLERLAHEAPGTYHHSLLVGNLAAAGARAIGADATLARLGGYYHDLGKLAAPGMFIENIDPAADPHLTMDPKTSAAVILRHVVDGIRLGRAAQLPETILRFIPEHTGTTLAYFFYVKAKRAAKRGTVVHKRDFRYPGPKPMSRETGIVMLADSVEAAVRAHRPQTDAALKTVIDEVVGEKVADTQLDLSGLDDKAITTLKTSFFQTLQHLHHRRVKYPKRRQRSQA